MSVFVLMLSVLNAICAAYSITIAFSIALFSETPQENGPWLATSTALMPKGLMPRLSNVSVKGRHVVLKSALARRDFYRDVDLATKWYLEPWIEWSDEGRDGYSMLFSLPTLHLA